MEGGRGRGAVERPLLVLLLVMVELLLLLKLKLPGLRNCVVAGQREPMQRARADARASVAAAVAYRWVVHELGAAAVERPDYLGRRGSVLRR